MHHKNSKSGFILLLAVLISTVIFTIGVTFSSILYKELILAFTARESQVSYYSADFGTECIRYWGNARIDPRFGPGVYNFDKMAPFDDDSDRRAHDQGKVQCNGVEYTLDPAGAFDFIIDDNQYCSSIVVERQEEGEDAYILATSWGFNTCDLNNKRRTDRALELYYSTY